MKKEYFKKEQLNFFITQIYRWSTIFDDIVDEEVPTSPKRRNAVSRFAQDGDFITRRQSGRESNLDKIDAYSQI